MSTSKKSDKARANVLIARDAIGKAGGLVAPREIAEEWGISEQAISRRISRGSFPEPIKVVGRVRLYLRDEVEPYREGLGPGGRAATPRR